MLRSILVGLDEPSHSEFLLELGTRWARRSGATLIGLAIVDEPGIRAIEPAWPIGGTPGVDPVLASGYEKRLELGHRAAGEMLGQFAERCSEAGVKHFEVQAVGSPAEIIEREAPSVDLVLLATEAHFRFTAREDAADRTPQDVLKHVPRPMVMVPAAPAPDGPIVIAYDGSLQAAHALAAFQATGLGQSGQVHIVSVHSDHQEAARHAESARKFLGYHGVEAIPHAEEATAAPANVILDHVRRFGAGLLVMGAYGQPVLRELLVGSATRTIVGECPVPLFLYH
jgi:nucleotide-binding universal stress UspA family protein